MPDLRHILIVSHGVNELDASGEEMLSVLISRLRDAGYDVSFSGLKDNVLDVLKRTHLYETIGEDHMFPTQALAIEGIHAKAHENSQEKECPLLKVCLIE
jgi:MFS superfamily sulfate permease-like transporter